jgi:hypothetical protein
MTTDRLYLLDLTGQLLAVSMSAGCVTADSTLTLVAGGLTGRRHLRADNNTVLLSGSDELRDGATGALLAATAPIVARFAGRVEDALVFAEGLTVTDGSTVATVQGLPTVWNSLCPSEGCAIGGAALLTHGTDGLSLLDLGDSGEELLLRLQNFACLGVGEGHGFVSWLETSRHGPSGTPRRVTRRRRTACAS